MPKFKELDEKLIIHLYSIHKNVYKVSEIIKCDDTTLLRRLNKLGIDTKRNIFKVNDDYFDNIDSKDKAYFLGLLVSDGCNNGKGFSISLQEKDVSILKLFKHYIEYEGNINLHNIKNMPNPDGYNRQNQYCLKVYSNKISTDLTKLYCIKNKTFFTKFPIIDKKFHSHFIRGVFDGDGSICIYQQKIKEKSYENYLFNITGYIPFLKEIQKVLVDSNVVKCNKINIPKRNKFTGRSEDIGMLQYSGSFNAIKLREYLYKDCGDLYLTRKKEKFDLIVPKVKKNYNQCQI